MEEQPGNSSAAPNSPPFVIPAHRHSMTSLDDSAKLSSSTFPPIKTAVDFSKGTKDWVSSGKSLGPALMSVPANPAPATPPSPTGAVARQRWHSAKTKVDAVVAIKEAPFRGADKVKSVDAFSNEPKEATWAGAWITILVWVATVAYTVIMVVQWVNAPATITVGTEWTIGGGPWPMEMTCMARSGCLVSNAASPGNTLGASSGVDPAQASCFKMAYNESVTVGVIFSVDPREGLSVMWDPTSTDGTSKLQGGGVSVHSQIRCFPDTHGCVQDLAIPVPPGTGLLQYVQTTNNTAQGPGINRNEWYTNMISDVGTVLAGSTPCVYDSTGAVDASLSTWVQARLRINSFYNTVDVSRDSFWLFLFGAVGGAYSIFLQGGALLVVTAHFMHSVYATKRQGVNKVVDEGVYHGSASVTTTTRRRSSLVQGGGQGLASRLSLPAGLLTGGLTTHKQQEGKGDNIV